MAAAETFPVVPLWITWKYTGTDALKLAGTFGASPGIVLSTGAFRNTGSREAPRAVLRRRECRDAVEEVVAAVGGGRRRGDGACAGGGRRGGGERQDDGQEDEEPFHVSPFVKDEI